MGRVGHFLISLLYLVFFLLLVFAVCWTKGGGAYAYAGLRICPWVVLLVRLSLVPFSSLVFRVGSQIGEEDNVHIDVGIMNAKMIF